MKANQSVAAVTRGKIEPKPEESRDAVPASATRVFCCGTELQSTVNIFFFFFYDRREHFHCAQTELI